MHRNRLVAGSLLAALLLVPGTASSQAAKGEPEAQGSQQATAQDASGQDSTGPIVQGYGPVYDIPDPDFDTPTDLQWKVVFEVARGADIADGLNASIETVARFLNMHARAGVPRQRMQVALVLHGTAGKDALGHAGYRERYGVDNPNLGLLQALAGAGVEIYLCGQTAAHRGLDRDELIPEVRVALSAMTVIGALQARGYRPVAYP